MILASLLSRVRSLWRNLFRRARTEEALDEELAAYVEELAAEHRRRGLGAQEARRAALLEVGGVERVKESVREAWAGQWIHDLWRDVRYSARALRNRPAFTAVAVATLALGLGGATAVFSVVNAVLFRTPPGIEDAGRVVGIDLLRDGVAWDGLSWPDLQALRESAHAFADIGAHVGAPVHLREPGGSARSVIVDFASGNYFRVLGTRAALGRLLTEDDADPRVPRPVVVLSHDFWSSHFGADPNVLGRTMNLGGTPFTVVGVASPEFGGTMTGQDIHVWAPLPMLVATGWVTPSFTADANLQILSTLGRLAPAATVAGARAEVAGRGMTVDRAFGRIPEMRRRDRPFLLMLASTVALLMLLACANVTAICLLRASSRRREMAARLALGASRLALARQLLIEGALIAVGAAVIGGTAAELFVTRSGAIASQLGRIPFGVDGRVLAFCAAATTLTVVLVSVLPVLRLGRVAPMSVLRAATAGSGRRVSGAQRGLVVFQVAGSMALVATATMIFTTFQRMLNADLGLDARDLAMLYFDPRQAGFDAERTREVIRRLEAAANAEPEIAAATLATSAPLLGRGSQTVYRDGEAPEGEEDSGGLKVGYAAVEPSYFKMLGIPLRSGRGFQAEDGPDAPGVAIVSRGLAMRLWDSDDAVGRHLQMERHNAPAARFLVVGVAEDVKHRSLTEEEQPVLYLPLVQQPPDGMLLIARGRAGTPAQVALTRLLADVDPQLYADGFWTTGRLMDNWVDTQRTVATWIGVAGLLALLLSALGVYGAVGHVVRERLRELAVRAAIGAEPWQLTALAMREGLLLTALGGGAGGLLLFWTWTIVRRSLEGMAGVDPAAVAGCALLLGLTMAAASYLPARRVGRISPVEVLRGE